jgi:hypothetical protein
MKLFFVTAVVVAACTTPSVLTPATGPGTAYPCGVDGHACSNKACCSNAEVCGGDEIGCPPTMCCFVGEDRTFSFDAGRGMEPQRPPK